MKKIGTICLAVILLLAITGCDMEVYNDDSKIVSDSNSYSGTNISQVTTDHRLKAKVGKMTGMNTIWEYDAFGEDDLNADYGLLVKKGKVKMVFISPEDEIEIIAELTEPGETGGVKSLPIKDGENRIKIVASGEAKFEYFLEIPKGEMEELGD